MGSATGTEIGTGMGIGTGPGGGGHATGTVRRLGSVRPTAHSPLPGSHAEEDQATLLGLYHGYDQARVALARLVARYGAEATSDAEMQRRIWARAERHGVARDLFDPPCELASSEGLNRGAHSAVLSAFAAISHQAEELLHTLRDRWPHLAEDAGGPLPAPLPALED